MEEVSKDLLRPLEEMNLPVRAVKALKNFGATCLWDATSIDPNDLLSLRNFGATTLSKLDARLSAYGERVGSRSDAGFRGADPHDPDAPIVFANLSKRLREFLQSQGATTWREAAELTSASVMAKPNLGAGTLEELRAQLALRGLQLSRSRVEATHASSGEQLDPEQTLGSLAQQICSERPGHRDLQILKALVGWDGGGAKTLDGVGREFGLTRERVRQVAAKVIRSLNAWSVFRDRLMQATRVLATAAPCTLREADVALRGAGLIEAQASASVVLELADRLELPHDVLELEIGATAVIVRRSDADLTKKIVSSVARQIDHWGAIGIDDLVGEQASSKEVSTIPRTTLTTVLSSLPGFEWLDPEEQWFWIKGRSRNRVVNRIRKILCVCECLSIWELRAGIARDHCMEGFAPPRHVLAKICESLPFASVDGTIVRRAGPVPRSVLGTTERKLVEILEANGGCMATDEIESAAQREGIGDPSIWRQLTYSCTLTRPLPGTYALRGAVLDPSQVAAQPRRAKSRRRVVDSGWMTDGNPWFAMEISRASLRRGIVNVPASLRSFVQGEWSVELRDGRKAGEVTVRNQSAWGLRAALVRRGVDHGDVVILEWNTSARRVLLVLGSEDVLLAYQEGKASFWSTQRS